MSVCIEEHISSVTLGVPRGQGPGRSHSYASQLRCSAHMLDWKSSGLAEEENTQREKNLRAGPNSHGACSQTGDKYKEITQDATHLVQCQNQWSLTSRSSPSSGGLLGRKSQERSILTLVYSSPMLPSHRESSGSWLLKFKLWLKSLPCCVA